MKSNKADSIRYIPVRPQAIKPKEAFRYSVESSGITNAVPQPAWKAASVLPVFYSSQSISSKREKRLPSRSTCSKNIFSGRTQYLRSP